MMEQPLLFEVFDSGRCVLGEGPLWHPLRNELFWFDIKSCKLFASDGKDKKSWSFEEPVSAAGWVDEGELLIASASGLFSFSIASGERSLVVALEADNMITRSNDGRADPNGGFWIGTMGKNGEPSAGAIYRYFKGELRKLFSDITTSNAICFTPDARTAYYTDTRVGKINAVDLNADGWPVGQPSVYLDFSDEPFGPDGAVVDKDGVFWNAQWGAGRVAGYKGDGTIVAIYELPTSQTTCPSFDPQGNLYITTARDGLYGDDLAGQTFVIPTPVKAQSEHRVIL